jgi:uncharacterized protein
MRNMVIRSLVLALAVALPAQAQNLLGQPEVPPGSDPALYRLPEREDIVPWRLLAQVKPVKVKDRLLPEYSDAVLALNQETVRIQGFMLPLEVGDKQTHFLLSAIPQSCPFHLHIGGAESLVEVKSSKPVVFTWNAVVMTGKLSVLKDDPDGVLYRLTDAVQSQ